MFIEGIKQIQKALFGDKNERGRSMKNQNGTCRRLLAMLLILVLVAANVPLPVTAETVNEDVVTAETATTEEYIEIRTVEDLDNVRNDLTANYILMNDIDLTEATKSGEGWNPIGGSSAFSGIFEGNNYNITGMRINTSYTYVGLFGNVSGTVKNLTVGGNVKGTTYTGGIAGYCTGTIKNCVNQASIYGSPSGRYAYIGGIIGMGNSSTRITNCVNTGYISGYTNGDKVYVSGIVGYGAARVSSSYNTGKIFAEAYGWFSTTITGTSTYIGYCAVSGIGYECVAYDCYNADTLKVTYESDGWANGSVYGIGNNKNTRCYNVGAISDGERIGGTTNTHCYYLSSSYSVSKSGTGMTGAQMRDKSKFTGFDFVNTWCIDSKSAYPYPQLRMDVALVSLVAPPNKTEYLTGDELVLDGAVIYVQRKNGDAMLLNVTADMVYGFDSNTPGEQAITVFYRGQSVTFPITMTERPVVTSIALSALPTTTLFYQGDSLDFSGAQLDVAYSDGTLKTISVTDDMLSGGDSYSTGKQTITVTYEGVTTSFEIEVVPIAVSGLRLASAPSKLTYLEGEELDLTGMILYTVMNNGAEIAVNSGYTVSGYASTPGTHTVTISYIGHAVSFDVTVREKSLVKMVMESAPTRTEYTSGQAFDATGLKLVGTYDNGDVEVITDYEISGFDTSVGVKTIVVSFGGMSVSFEVTVSGYSITGSIKSDASDGAVTIRLMQDREEIGAVTTKEDSYVLQNLSVGTYQLEVSKNNHATRTYTVTVAAEDVSLPVEINLLGDANCDGKVNMKDWNQLYEHLNEVSELTGYEWQCADVNGDGKVNMKDWNRVYEHLSETKPLW